LSERKTDITYCWRMRFLADCTHLFPELEHTTAQLGEKEIEIETEDILPGRAQTDIAKNGLFRLSAAREDVALAGRIYQAQRQKEHRKSR
jgi:hypothetical protein